MLANRKRNLSKNNVSINRNSENLQKDYVWDESENPQIQTENRYSTYLCGEG